MPNQLRRPSFPGIPIYTPPLGFVPKPEIYTASTSARSFAQMLDQVIVIVLIAGVIGRDPVMNALTGKPTAPQLVVGLGIYLIYHAGFLAWRSATPGKLLCRIRVVSANDDSARLTPRAILLRVVTAPLFFPLTNLPYAIALFRADRRHASDLIAGTRVITSTPTPEPRNRWFLGSLIIVFSLAVLLFQNGMQSKLQSVNEQFKAQLQSNSEVGGFIPPGLLDPGTPEMQKGPAESAEPSDGL